MSKANYKVGYLCTHEDHDRLLFVGEHYKDWTKHYAEEHGNKETRPKHTLLHDWSQSIAERGEAQWLRKGDVADCGWVFPGQEKIESGKLPQECKDCFGE